ncbi:hypothetical protein HJFPF1_06476 [Paramyrothecium foliicola]|nr:hypothetical protein HJFPF1_06476 [Paramyrothecium foliicola]
MPRRTNSAWDNVSFLEDLIIALYQTSQAGGSLNPNARAAMTDFLVANGHEVTWEAIRYARLCSLTWRFYFLYPMPLVVESSSPFAMGSRQTMRWDAKVHEDILICMFQHLQLTGDQWVKVMAELRTLGYTFTDSALKTSFNISTLGFTAKPLTIIPFSFFANFPSLTMATQPCRPGPWDTIAHETLLSVVLEEVKPNKDMLTTLTEKMNAQGYNFTFSAMKQHVQKLRKTRDTSGLGAAASPAKSSKNTTPRKRSTPKKAAKLATPAQDDYDDIDFIKSEADYELGGEDDDDIESPSAKRTKTEEGKQPSS